MDKKLSTRRATKEDLNAIRNLVIELAVFEREPDAVTATLNHYEDCFDDGLIEIILVEEMGQILGMALYYEAFSTWKGKMLYLEDFIVLEKHRKRGIGNMLFEAFIGRAKEKSCTMVKWQVLDWNELAIGFYEKRDAVFDKDWWNGKIIF